MIGLHRTMALVALILGGAAAASDTGTGTVGARRLVADIAAERDWTTAVALAERIKAGERPSLFDLRGQDEFQRFHIPSAVPATLTGLLETRLPRSTFIVLYGDGVRAAQAWTLLRMRGYRDVFYLREGLYEWIARVHEPALPVDATPAERADFDRRAALSRYFGGQPRVDVPRAQMPAGYWTAGADLGHRPPVATALLVAAIRRRGC